jgi:nicotinamide mononucleotide transporter PnuC
MPMSVIALVSWLRNPYENKKSEVKVNRISTKETVFALLLTAAVTVAFYFILDAFDTANIIPSTISVTTSFLAVYLTWRRSPYYALAYAANDVVLIILWVMASVQDASYLSVTVCFAVFLVNDLYGFFSWRRMEKRQRK